MSSSGKHGKDPSLVPYFVSSPVLVFEFSVIPLPEKQLYKARNISIGPLTKILWQRWLLLYVHGRTAAWPCLVFNMGLMVPTQGGGWDLELPPAPVSAPMDLCGKVQPVFLQAWEQASSSSGLQPVLDSRLSRAAPEKNKKVKTWCTWICVTKVVSIWTWMEDELPAGQSYCCILTPILVLLMHFLHDRWWWTRRIRLLFFRRLDYVPLQDLGKQQDSMTLSHLQKWPNGPFQP